MSEENNAKTSNEQAANLKQISVLFCEIAAEIAILKEVLDDHSQESQKGSFYALYSVAQKTGYMADKGREKSSAPRGPPRQQIPHVP